MQSPSDFDSVRTAADADTEHRLLKQVSEARNLRTHRD